MPNSILRQIFRLYMVLNMETLLQKWLELPRAHCAGHKVHFAWNVNKLCTFKLINLNTYWRWNKCFAEYHSSSAALGFTATIRTITCNSSITPQKAALWIQPKCARTSTVIWKRKAWQSSSFAMMSEVMKSTYTWGEKPLDWRDPQRTQHCAMKLPISACVIITVNRNVNIVSEFWWL